MVSEVHPRAETLLCNNNIPPKRRKVKPNLNIMTRYEGGGGSALGGTDAEAQSFFMSERKPGANPLLLADSTSILD